MKPLHKSFLISKQDRPIYSFLNSFLISGDQSKVSQYLIFLLSELQYIAILLWALSSLLTSNTDDPTTSVVYNWTRVIIFEEFFDQDNAGSYIQTFVAAIWVYFILISFSIGYLASKAIKRQQVEESLQTTLCSIFQFHFGFIFWFVNIILMILMSDKTANITLFSQFNSSNQTFYIIHLIILILNYAFGILTALFCFDPFCSNNVFASQTSFFQFLNFLFKAIIAPIFAFSPRDETYIKVIFIVIALIISVGRAIYLIYNFPFHYYTPMKLASVFAITNFWICFINIIAIISLKSGMSLSPIYLVIFPLPAILKLLMVRLRCIVEHYMSVNPQSLQSKRQIFKKLFVGRLLEENVRLSLNDNVPLNRCEIYFIGDLTLHSKSCEDNECLCSVYLRDKTKKGNNSSLNITKSSLLAYFHNMNHMFLGEAIKKIKDSNDLKISIAHSIFSHQAGSLSTALSYLFSTSEDTLHFFVRMKRNILARKIQERMRSQSDENLKGDINWAEFVDYHTDATDFLTQISANTENYINFWESFKRNNVKMTDMVEKSNQIEAAADRIDKLWIYYVERYETFYRLLKDAYKMYLILVRNAPFTSKKMVKKFQWKRKLKDVLSAFDEITEEDLVSAQVISFYVSMMREKIGRVLYVSDNIQNSIGYSPQEVTGKNINFLLPPAVAEKHDQMLLRHLDKSKTSQAKDYFNTKSYIKIKGGTLVPCSTHVAIFPYIQKELIYIGVVKMLPIKCECIIMDSTGYIDSFTKSIGQKLGLYIDKRTHIRDVCINEERLGINLETRTLVVGNQTSRTDTQFLLHKEGSTLNINMSKEDIETEFPEISVSLTFFNPGIKGKYFKYDVKVTKKLLLNKRVYILEMERNFSPEQEQQKLRKDSIEDDFFKEVGEEDSFDIPAEIPLPVEIVGLTDSARVKYKINMTSAYMTQRTEGFTDRPLVNPRKLSDSNEGRQVQKTTIVSKQLKSRNFMRMESRMEFEQEQDSDNDLMDIGMAVNVPGQDKSKKSIKSGKFFHKFFEMQSERGSTASTAHKVHPKLEKAIYSLPPEKSTQILKLTILGLITSCIILLLIFQGNTQQNLQLMKGNIEVITTSNLRLFQITDINKRTRAISLYLASLFTNGRYTAYRLTSIVPTEISLIKGVQSDLNTYNNKVRADLNNIEPELQKEFYSSPIPVIGLDQNGQVEYFNTFDAATTIIVKAKELVKLTTSQIKANNSQMNYILNNTLNELLLMSEDVTDIILADNDYKLDFLRDLIVYFIVVCCILGAIMLALFFYNQFKSVQSRNKFIEMLLRLSDEEVDMNLTQVRTFKTGVGKNGLNFRHLQLDEITAAPANNNTQPATKAVKSFRARRREGNVQGINTKVFLAQIFAVGLFILALAPLIYISVIFNQKKNIIKQEVGTIVQVNTNLYDLNLLSTAIYEYIQFNGTTRIRTRPINEEWENTYSRVAASQTFFASLFQVKNGNKVTTDPELEQLLAGDLCQVMNTSALICSLGNGTLGNGIMGLNSYVLQTLRQVKDAYDLTKTVADAKKALSMASLVGIEYLYAVMQLPVYEKLGEILEERVETHIQEIDELLKTPVVVSVVLYIVLGYVLSTQLVRLIREERIRWKKMFRKIPFNVVINNKTFKNFLVKEAGHILSSMKSSI